ncbi:MAG: gliding motility protein GldM [Bacteroidales bacterium]|jgi:gliding motility-associated protein GldM|nr:gliding motility protein GldM [Bacteroidales bacterium]
MSGGGKETPRQAMIGMMYLFYTALLALNVSAEILTAFSLVDGSLRKTNTITEGVIADTQNEFVKAMVNDSAGVAPYKALADQVITEADKAYNEIQHWKEQLVFTLEGVSSEEELRAKHDNDQESYIGDLVSKKDDNNVGGQIFITEGHSTDIKKSRESYRDFLISIVNKDTVSTEQAIESRKSLINSLEQMLSTEDTKSLNDEGEMLPWEVANFEHLPAAGVLSLMTKMQSDVRNTESSMLTYLLSQIGKADMKFNAIKAVVNSPKSYVLVGEPYKAEIFIAAYDSTQNPDILVGGSPVKVVNGVGQYTGNTSAPGPKSFGGVIKLKNKSTGEIKDYPFKGEYEVGQSSLSVSPTKMNVLYIGVPNPIDVTASGYDPSKLHVSISQGSIPSAGKPGQYHANVKQQGTANITVTATVDGQTKNLGTRQFRVMRVPNPTATVNGQSSGLIGKAILAAQQGVKADMGSDFVFDMKFNVTSFKVSTTIRGFVQDAVSNGPAFSAQQKQIINSANVGSKIYIEEIKARGPDGSIRDLSPICLKLK